MNQWTQAMGLRYAFQTPHSHRRRLVRNRPASVRFCYPWVTMSAINGDKARFHRERKGKLARRERSQALRKKLAEPMQKRPDGRDL